MTTKKITPGPWRMRKNEAVPDSAINILTSKEDDYQWIASVHVQFLDDFPLEQAEATARLIQSAPEMYELLRAGLEDGDPMNWDKVSELLEKINEGEKQPVQS